MGPDMNIIIFELTLPRRNIIVEEDQDNLKKHVEAFSWVRSENAFSSRLILLVITRQVSPSYLPRRPSRGRYEGRPSRAVSSSSTNPTQTAADACNLLYIYISHHLGITSASRPCALLHTYLWHTSHQ